MNNYIETLFNLKDKIAVVIGGGGHLCSEIVKAFAMAECKVAILDLRIKKALNHLCLWKLTFHKKKIMKVA